MNISNNLKPLGRKAYGSIGHLPNSRMGPKEHHVHEGQQRICTLKARDKHDVITVTEKLDGTNVAVAHINGEIVALIRAGWPAESSPREMHQMFARWVEYRRHLFAEFLCDGEALHGEWMAQAHGTLYDIGEFPFVAFDLTEQIFGGKGKRERIRYSDAVARCGDFGIQTARVLSSGPPVSVDAALMFLNHGRSFHGVRDGEMMEGAVWRVERRGKFDFMAKWVDPRKVDGKYLPEQSGKPAVWLWGK